MLAGPAATRIALPPYPDEVTEAEATMSGRCHITLTGWADLSLDDGCDTVTRGQVRKLISGGRPCCDR